MDVREFVKKQDSALKRYHRIYKILDFIGTTIILYLLLFYLGVDKVFPFLTNFEVKVGLAYNILGMSIKFETLALTLIASVFSVIITVLRHLRDKKAKAIMLIENKYPELRERLRTAYDNANVDNLIVSDLISSVTSGISSIASSDLLARKKITIGLAIILLSSVSTVYVVDNDVRTTVISPEDIAELIEDIPFIGNNGDSSDGLYEIEGEDSGNSSTRNTTSQQTEVIIYDGVDVDLTLSSSSGEGFVNEEEASEEDVDFEQSSSYETSIISSEAYYEEFPEGYESIIKSYFEELAKT